MSKKLVYFLAGLMLAFMGVIAFFSMKGDSAIMDEVAHLPAGYSYIEKADMRLNPEHPTLIKDLAGGAVWLWSKISGTKLNFPENNPAWTSDINGQWNFGFDFMYQRGNDADKMLLWGRLPILILMLILGIYVFKWAMELFGPGAGLLSLFLYSFSPTFLAHGRFVTTDVAAAAGIFIASYYFVKWLKNPGIKTLVIAGLVFGLAQLAKFSCFLLIPLFLFVALIWIILKAWREGFRFSLFWNYLWKYLGGTILIFAVGYIFIVWPIYLYHVANYPAARQQRDASAILATFGMRPIANLIVWMAGIPVLRGLAEYGLGLAMVLQRASGGNTAYFLGEVSASGSRLYFPFVYLAKETITLHALTLIALLVFLVRIFKEKLFRIGNLLSLLFKNIDGVIMISFIALYWYSSLTSTLNIGVRHVLPTFPFIFLLVSGQISLWLKPRLEVSDQLPFFQKLSQVMRNAGWLVIKYILVYGLIIFQIVSVISVYPSFLAYFNETFGGAKDGYKYVVDSNLDWGQDLKRLAAWTDQNNVDKIYVEYFGGAVVPYYLGDKFRSWWGTRSPLDLNEKGGYLAISATFLQNGRGVPTPDFYDPAGYYNWLNRFTPVAVIGHSIFVYYIPPHSFNAVANN